MVLRGNEEMKKETRFQKVPINWKDKNLLKHQIDVITAPHGQTCGFILGEAETTETHNRSLQDKHSYNYNFGLNSHSVSTVWSTLKSPK